MKLLQACLNARGDEESIFSLVWRCCDARADLFKYQEVSRKQFSSLCMYWVVRAGLFKCRDGSTKPF